MNDAKKHADQWRSQGQRAAEKIGYKLPEGITMTRGPAVEGVAFYFHHPELGELGRVRVVDQGDGHGRLLGEVAGEPDDPKTSERAKHLGPLIQQVHHLFDEAAGVPHRAVKVAPTGLVTQEERGGLQIKLLECNRCEHPVARLIFAPPETIAQADFEDIARLTFRICSEVQVPTWIVGPGDVGDILTEPDPMDVRSSVMQIWPNRSDLFRSSPSKFNDRIEALQEAHCGKVR